MRFVARYLQELYFKIVHQLVYIYAAEWKEVLFMKQHDRGPSGKASLQLNTLLVTSLYYQFVPRSVYDTI